MLPQVSIRIYYWSVLQVEYRLKTCSVVVNTLSPPVALCRNPTMFAASSPTMSSPLYSSSRSAAAIRWSTSGCWRTSGCGVPASPTDRHTLASYRGTLNKIIILQYAPWPCNKCCFTELYLAPLKCFYLLHVGLLFFIN